MKTFSHICDVNDVFHNRKIKPPNELPTTQKSSPVGLTLHDICIPLQPLDSTRSWRSRLFRPRRLHTAVRDFTVALIAAILMAIGARPAHAQADTGHTESLRLVGVLDAKTGDWINRAVLRDTLGNETLTSRDGVAALNVLTPIAGFYLIEIRKEGYAPRRIRLRADTTVQLMIALEPNPLGEAASLPAVVTTARRRLEQDDGERRGLFDRCLAGVDCVGRAELDRRPTGTLDNLLGHKPGIHEECAPPDHGAVYTKAVDQPRDKDLMGCLITMRPSTGPGYCTPTYFVDGFEWQPLGGTPQAQIDKFLPPNRIEAIEIYPSNAPHPPRFSTGVFSGCGAVVIWTR